MVETRPLDEHQDPAAAAWPWRLPSARRLLAAAAVLLPVCLAVVLWPRGGADVLVSDDFDGPSRLVTNEWATYNPDSPDAVRSPVWLVTSGSLFTKDGNGWTGIPDVSSPDPRSATATNSAVFRAITQRADIGDALVSFRMRVDHFIATPASPGHPWDGVHVFLRYESEEQLYVVSIDRRDGAVAVKKKVRGGRSNGGTYVTLASASAPARAGEWHDYEVSARRLGDTAVSVRLVRDGEVILSTTDAGIGGRAITEPGRVGLRGDNTEFLVDRFRVTRAS